MGEYVKFRNERIKIGTCESLYYATYPKYVDALQNGLLAKLEGSASPEEYAQPDAGFRFRFPFPDEDKLTLGAVEYNFRRGVMVKIETHIVDENTTSADKSKIQIYEIVQQKLVHREADKHLLLATVWRDSAGEHFRIDDEQTMKKMLGQLIKHHVLNETDPQKKEFYRKIALRILKGYRFNIRQDIRIEQNQPHASSQKTKAPLLQHLWQQAYSAYYNNSFSPEKRADQLIRQYSEELKKDLDTINSIHLETKSLQDVSVIKSTYQNKYENNLSSWLRSTSATASPMITGPANFPSEKMKKRMRWANNKYNTFRQWREKSLKAISKNLQPSANELEQSRENLKRREETQRLMIAANKVVRKGGSDMLDDLRALKLSEGLIMQILNTGFRPYQLKNNNAEIRRLRSRVTVLEAKQNLAQINKEKIVQLEGVKLVQNYDLDRVQLKFDGKPDQQTIDELKSRGFRWTPSQMAWQRKLTNQAIEVAQKIAIGIKR